MNKKEVVSIIFLSIFLIIIISPVGNADVSEDNLEIGVTIEQPILRINVIEDYINLGKIVKGHSTNPKPFNITNTGTIDIKIQPINITDEIFSNIWIGNSNTTGYKRIGGFVGNVSQDKTQDFWIKLDLKDYTGEVAGNLSTQITFFILEDNE